MTNQPMTLQVVHDDPRPLTLAPIGSSLADLAYLWVQIVNEGPRLGHSGSVQHKSVPGQQGTIIVHFDSELAMVAVSRHLGFDLLPETLPTGTRIVGARGSVTRDGRTATVELHCTISAQGGVA